MVWDAVREQLEAPPAGSTGTCCALASRAMSSGTSRIRNSPWTRSRRPSACRPEAFIAHSKLILPARFGTTSGCVGSIIAPRACGTRRKRIGRSPTSVSHLDSRALRISATSSRSTSGSLPANTGRRSNTLSRRRASWPSVDRTGITIAVMSLLADSSNGFTRLQTLVQAHGSTHHRGCSRGAWHGRQETGASSLRQRLKFENVKTSNLDCGGIAASSLRRRLKLEPVAVRQDVGGKLLLYGQVKALPPA